MANFEISGAVARLTRLSRANGNFERIESSGTNLFETFLCQADYTRNRKRNNNAQLSSLDNSVLSFLSRPRVSNDVTWRYFDSSFLLDSDSQFSLSRFFPLSFAS